MAVKKVQWKCDLKHLSVLTISPENENFLSSTAHLEYIRWLFFHLLRSIATFWNWIFLLCIDFSSLTSHHSRTLELDCNGETDGNFSFITSLTGIHFCYCHQEIKERRMECHSMCEVDLTEVDCISYFIIHSRQHTLQITHMNKFRWR